MLWGRYAALDVASGKVISDLTGRHRAEEFRRFLNLIDRSVPVELDVHVIVDNSCTHKTPAIRRWLLRHPRFSLLFTPTYSSWLNLVERWFAIVRALSRVRYTPKLPGCRGGSEYRAAGAYSRRIPTPRGALLPHCRCACQPKCPGRRAPF